METFKALVVDTQDDQFRAEFRQLTQADLPEGDVLVRVSYSTLNYKDGLAVTNRGKIVRSFPLIPGIDFAGTVVESHSERFAAGDAVVLTGWGVGEKHSGGFAQMARVPGEWLVPLPAGLTMQQAMGIGTAGFTAMLSVLALEEHGVHPGAGEVVVTGASGGVGSVAVAVLAQRGYKVVAATGRASSHEYLSALGATSLVARDELTAPSKRPLDSERWSGAVDTVGGAMLAGVLRGMARGSSVAICGLAGGTELNTTVMPFILRGVTMVGIDSVMCPLPRRMQAWERLAQDLPLPLLDEVITLASLDDVPALSNVILDGRVRGRMVIDVNA